MPTENTDWFNYGGIYRDIELLYVPELYIKSFHTALVSEGLFRKTSPHAVLYRGKNENVIWSDNMIEGDFDKADD